MENEHMNWKLPEIESVLFFRLSSLNPTGANITVVEAANFHFI